MYQIIDNFLNEEKANHIENLLFSNNFPWYYQPFSVSLPINVNINNNYFTSWPGLRHIFYIDESFNSSISQEMIPLFNEFKNVENNIKLKSLIANLNMPVTSTEEKYGIPHVDQRPTNLTKQNLTGIYYVNDCDGDTILFKEKFDGNSLLDYNLNIKARIQPRKNRFVYWDSRTYHAAPICNTVSRIVVVLNVTVVVN